jgi:uncharacterized protein
MRRQIAFILLSFLIGSINPLRAAADEAEKIASDARKAYSSKDYIQSKLLLEKAIKLGHTQSMIDLGHLYENGKGVPVDVLTALSWYKKAAETKTKGSEKKIGLLYEKGGPGLPQDYKEAMKWYRIGADRGESGSFILIGTLYENGYGVAQDFDEAIKWYEKGEKAGGLGKMYIDRLKEKMKNKKDVPSS